MNPATQRRTCRNSVDWSSSVAGSTMPPLRCLRLSLCCLGSNCESLFIDNGTCVTCPLPLVCSRAGALITSSCANARRNAVPRVLPVGSWLLSVSKCLSFHLSYHLSAAEVSEHGQHSDVQSSIQLKKRYAIVLSILSYLHTYMHVFIYVHVYTVHSYRQCPQQCSSTKS